MTLQKSQFSWIRILHWKDWKRVLTTSTWCQISQNFETNLWIIKITRICLDFLKFCQICPKKLPSYGVSEIWTYNCSWIHRLPTSNTLETLRKLRCWLGFGWKFRWTRPDRCGFLKMSKNYLKDNYFSQSLP